MSIKKIGIVQNGPALSATFKTVGTSFNQHKIPDESKVRQIAGINDTHIDETYQRLMTDILTNGTDKGDRTGTGTRSVFGRMINHDMRNGFPLLTTKKMFTRGITSELLWFLRGETNQTSIVEEGTKIWLGDGVKKWLREADDTVLIFYNENKSIKEVRIASHAQDIDTTKYISSVEFFHLNTDQMYKGWHVDKWLPQSSQKDITNAFQWLLLNNYTFAEEWGDLGPIYGKQWRDWGGVDQIREVVETLKSNPNSRRIMVNAWNVPEVKLATLPPCHYGFQFWTRPLSNREIYHAWYMDKCYPQYKYDGYVTVNITDDFIEELKRDFNVPTIGLSLLWNQRSVDTFLGLGFNIASYGILLHIIGKICNMMPLELNGMLGDTHLYSNHFDATETQLIRDPRPLPTLRITDEIDWTADVDAIIHSLKIEDFTFENYDPHPTIKAPLSN